MPLYEALQFVSTTLQNYGLDRQILIIAKASITSGFDMVKALALGAHAVRTVMSDNSAINYQDKCFSNIDNMSSCYPLLQLSEFQQIIMEDMARVMEALGFKSVEEMSPASFFRKLCVLDKGEIKDRNDFLLLSRPSKILIERHQARQNMLMRCLQNKKNKTISYNSLCHQIDTMLKVSFNNQI